LVSNVATWGKVRALSADPNCNIIFETERYNDTGLKAHHSLQKKNEYSETLLDGLHLFINPHAVWPVPPSVLNWPGVAYHSIDLTTGIPVDQSPDRFLFWRQTMTLPDGADIDEKLRAARAASGIPEAT